MTLGLKPGLFYRGARLHCINLLLSYDAGCRARCAYCGLSKARPGRYTTKSFIRVTWPNYQVDEVLERMDQNRKGIHRICLSMVTRRRAVADTETLCQRLRQAFDIPISILVSPTVVGRGDLERFRAAGADKAGVAVDLATQALFDRFRGSGVHGPHRWERYWRCLEECLDVFGAGNAGSHFMVGMGETEEEMCRAIQRVRDMGGTTHLFSFYPEGGSALSERRPPPISSYRRIQLARYLIDEGRARVDDLVFDKKGKIRGFGLPVELLSELSIPPNKGRYLPDTPTTRVAQGLSILREKEGNPLRPRARWC